MKVGVDIIEIERIERALSRPGFRERCFTDAEREYCDSRTRPAQSYAGRPTISISFHVKRTPQPSAFPTASFPANRPA